MRVISMYDTQVSSRDWDMLDKAAEIAWASTMRHKHGAILYKSGRTLAVGINSMRNWHPTMEIDPKHYSTHAEQAVMRAMEGFSLQGATIYVARVNRSGLFLNSEPCNACATDMECYGIKRVVYSDRRRFV